MNPGALREEKQKSLIPLPKRNSVSDLLKKVRKRER
jgi:hypothetical protein